MVLCLSDQRVLRLYSINLKRYEIFGFKFRQHSDYGAVVPTPWMLAKIFILSMAVINSGNSMYPVSSANSSELQLNGIHRFDTVFYVHVSLKEFKNYIKINRRTKENKINPKSIQESSTGHTLYYFV